ncbi:hypothetical protein D3C87_1297690 [compost metagenome]
MKNFYILLLLPLLLFSCKKEYPDYPYAELQQFTVKDAKGNELKAVIKGGEIMLYWPPMQDLPDFISPAVVVSERAGVLPASGESVPFKDGTTYTVTAQNGTTRQYKLKLALNQVKPLLIVGTSAPVGAYFSVGGDFFIPDAAKTSVFLVDSKSKEIQLKNPLSISPINISFYLPELEEGSYRVKLTSGIHTVFAKDLLAITYSASPVLDRVVTDYPRDLKRGGEYQYRFTGTPISKITKLRLRLLADNSFQEVEIISRNADNTVVIKIPPTMPVGTYSAFEISSSVLASPFVRNLSAAYRIVVSE